MTFHSEALESGDEETGGGRTLSRGIASQWEMAGRRGKRNIHVTPVLPIPGAMRIQGRNWFHLLETSALLHSSFTKGSLTSPPRNVCCWAYSSCGQPGTETWSYIFCFVLFAISFVFVEADDSNAQGWGPYSKVETCTFLCPSFSLPLAGLVGVGGGVAKGLDCPADGGAGPAALGQLLCLTPLFQ